MNHSASTYVPVEREHPDPVNHPSVDTWIDYHAGRLPDQAAEGLRQHLAGCRRCVDLVLDFDAFAEPSPPRAGAAADFEKAAVWRTVKRAVDPHAASRGGLRRSASEWSTVVAVAASLFFAVVGLSQRGARIDLEAQVAELTRPRPNMVIADLRPGARERSSGGVDATVELAADRGVTLVLHLEDEVDYPEYHLRVIDAESTEVDRIPGLRISELGNFSLGLAPGAFAAGEYELRLFGLVGGVEELLETYLIRLH